MRAISRCAALVVTAFLTVPSVRAESAAPPALRDLAGKNLKAGQEQLTGWNYEIVHSTLAGGHQHWWNNAAQSCVLLKFDGSRKISAVGTVSPQECKDYARQAAEAQQGSAGPP